MNKSPILLKPPMVKPNERFVIALGDKFSVITNNQLITPAKQEEIWQRIFSAHNHSTRAYHNLSHLYSITQVFDQYDFPNSDQSLFYWITFFHDIIYKATRKDNEIKSALLAKELLTPILPENQVKIITTIIESTAKHQPLVDIPEQYAFLDADLAILASHETLYDQYTQAIRQEYRIYPDLLYRPGRRKVLKHFLERTDIYYTPTFKALEGRARANLQRELERL